jgi:poly-gamma-glutamate synthesis protein (capsule biosynthesis protein)
VVSAFRSIIRGNTIAIRDHRGEGEVCRSGAGTSPVSTNRCDTLINFVIVMFMNSPRVSGHSFPNWCAALLRAYAGGPKQATRGASAVLFMLLLLGGTARAQSAHPPTEIRVAAVGDIMLGGDFDAQETPLGFDHPFAGVVDVLRSADVAFGNLEGPLTTRGSAKLLKRHTFRSPPQPVASALARAGFDVVSLANNHILDYGPVGLEDSITALGDAGIHYVGAGTNAAAARRPVFLDVRGTRVAFLAYSLIYPAYAASATQAGTAFGTEDAVCADVRAARAQSDVVLVSVHWGRQWSDRVQPDQQRLAHAAIDAGATAVFGHHPHVLQGVERYRDGAIFYSLGNFTFGLRNKRIKRSAIAELRLKGDRVIGISLLPLDVDNDATGFQPRPLRGAEADDVVEHLRQLSAPLATAAGNLDGKAQIGPHATH